MQWQLHLLMNYNYLQNLSLILNQLPQNLTKEDIIEHSTSPWCAQVVVVVKNSALPNKKRLSMDYCQPVNHTRTPY